jgi:hypothetical protein
MRTGMQIRVGERMRPVLTAISLAVLILITLLSLSLASHGCKNDENPVKPPDTTHTGPQYGSGSLSFDASAKGGTFSVSGAYKPSDQFANDTLSSGAGGFRHDTTLFGRTINLLLTAYTHRLHVDTIRERVMQIALYGNSNAIAAGDYPFAPSNAAQPGQAAYVYYFYNNSDSGAFNEVYIPKSGTLHLSSFDAGTKRAQGTFSGTLWGPLPDTTVQVVVTSGAFDITLVSSYFNP